MNRHAPVIVDAHVHLWDPDRFRYPWLKDLPVLQRAMLPAEFAAASDSSHVAKFIFVECGCDASQSLEEVDWAIALSKIEPRLRGIIAHAPLELGKSVRANLESLAERSLVKGVRRNLQGEPESFLKQPAFIGGVNLLPEFNFTLDLCIRSEQLPAANELVRRAPQVTFVLDHFGKPPVRSNAFEPWASNLRLLAEAPNVCCKISGLTTEANWTEWQPETLSPYFDHVLSCFGPERVMFGSDWPVSTLATSYERWIQTVLELVPNVGECELVQLFQTNAERIYRV